MSEDKSPAEKALERDRITFRRNPELAHDFLKYAYPHAKNEQQAIEFAMHDKIQETKPRLSAETMFRMVRDLIRESNGDLTLTLEGDAVHADDHVRLFLDESDRMAVEELRDE